MSNLVVANKSDLVAIADAIRTKVGSSDSLSFPQGFIDAINLIGSGESGGETYSDTLTWDGDTSGRETVKYYDLMNTLMTYVHVSDNAPTLEELSNFTIVDFCDGDEYVTTEQDFTFKQKGDILYLDSGSIIIALADNVEFDDPASRSNPIFPKKGTYFSTFDFGGYVSSFTVPNYNFE